jgi:hypothetical protein
MKKILKYSVRLRNFPKMKLESEENFRKLLMKLKERYKKNETKFKKNCKEKDRNKFVYKRNSMVNYFKKEQQMMHRLTLT